MSGRRKERKYLLPLQELQIFSVLLNLLFEQVAWTFFFTTANNDTDTVTEFESEADNAVYINVYIDVYKEFT